MDNSDGKRPKVGAVRKIVLTQRGRFNTNQKEAAEGFFFCFAPRQRFSEAKDEPAIATSERMLLHRLLLVLL